VGKKLKKSTSPQNKFRRRLTGFTAGLGASQTEGEQSSTIGELTGAGICYVVQRSFKSFGILNGSPTVHYFMILCIRCAVQIR
jgi:hypothetical protein